MENKKFIFFSFILFFFLLYILFGILGILELNKNQKNLFRSLSDLEFHKKYSQKLHHLRDSNRWGAIQNDYLYSEINKNKDFTGLVLLQGDSWMEQVQEVNGSLKIFKNFAQEKKLNIINAGITSFSPSLMKLQYQILKKEFKIKPDIIVAYIDQTDIGDENCRYQKNKKVIDGTLIGVKRESFSSKVYDYTKIYNYSKIYLESRYPIKFFKLSNFKIQYFIKRTVNRFNEIIDIGWYKRNNVKCRFQQIQKYLFQTEKSSEIIFKNSIEEYLHMLEDEVKIKKVFLVSFPHLNHLKKIYKVDVANFIEEVIKKNNFSKVSHINFNDFQFSKFGINKIYIEGDPSSHLKDIFHEKIFSKTLVKNLNLFYENNH